MKLVKIISMSLLAVATVGCASHGGGGFGGSYGNYKCTATAKGYNAVGWSTNQSDAEANALDKCREHTGGGACQITGCSSD